MAGKRKVLDPQWVAEVGERKMSARARRVFNYIVEHGEISTYDIENVLGEAHAPRAVADLKDAGVPVVQEGYIVVDGKRRGLYHLDPDAPIRAGMVGRTGFSNAFRKRLLAHYGNRCQLCGTEYEPRHLQPDHRIPVLVGGDEPDAARNVADYMPVCRSCNRSKSYDCERCPNGLVDKDPDVCRTCLWASPENYEHIATRDERRLELVWTGQREVAAFDRMVSQAQAAGQTLADFVRRRLGRS